MKLALLLLGIITLCYSIPILTPYRSLDISGANKDPIITSLLQFGAKETIQRGLEEKMLSHPDFHLSKVNSIHMQASNGLNYKFDVNLKDQDGITVNSAFTMNYQPRTQEKSLSSLSYSVKKKTHAVPQLAHFETVDSSILHHDPEVAKLLEFGVHDLLQEGIHNNKIPLKQFKLGNMMKIQKHDLGFGSGSYYHFNVDLHNDHGTQIMAAMTLFHNPDTREKEVIDSSYKVQPFVSHLQISETLKSDPNEYFDVDVSTVATTPEIQDALQYGVSEVIKQGIGEQKIPISEFTVDKITKVEKLVAGYGVNYKFQVALVNEQKTTNVQAAFTVTIRSSDQTKSVTINSYQVQTKTVTTTKSVEPSPDGYTLVSADTANSDSQIQTCLKYGVSEILRQAKSEGKIDSENYSVTQLTSVETQTVEGYAFYRFNAEMKNNKDSTLSALFVVVYNLATRKPGMKSFLFKVVTLKTASTAIVTDAEGYAQIELLDVQINPEIQACLEFGVSQIIQKGLTEKKLPISEYSLSNVNTASKRSVGEITFYKFDCDLTNGADTSVRATFTIQYNTKTATRSLKAFSYNAKTVTSTKAIVKPDETAYEDVSSTEISSNADIKGALDFCTTEVLQNALTQGKITQSTGFKITKVTKVRKQTVGSYFFTTIEMDLGDSATTTVSINAVVALNKETGERQLISYVYNVRITTIKLTSIKDPADSEFTSVSAAVIAESVEIQGVLAYGVDQILQSAFKQGKIKDTSFTVQSVTCKSASASGATFYRFVLKLTNGKGTTIDATCTILHESSGRDSPRSYQYDVKVTSSVKTVVTDPEEGDYTNIDVADIASDGNIQAGLQFAVQATLKDALDEGKIKTKDGFNVQKITRVGKAIVSKYIFYRLVITLDNDEDTTIDATAIVLYDTKATQFSLRNLTYNVKFVQNVASTIEEPADNQFIDVETREVESSNIIQSVLGVGTQQILQAALTEGKIKDTNFRVINVEWVKRATVKVFTFYRFKITLSNDDDTTITATFTIIHNSRSGENSLRRYDYNVRVIIWTVSNFEEPASERYTSFESSEIQSNEQTRKVFYYGVDQIISTALQRQEIKNAEFVVTTISRSSSVTVKQFTFYRFAFVLDNDDDTTIDVTCTLVYDSKTGEVGVRVFTYNVTVTQTLINEIKEPADDDYRDVDISVVETDETVKQSFTTGIKQILEKALAEGKISSTANFNVKSITLCRTATAKKYIFYRFSVNLDNDDDTTVDCTFTVVHSTKTGEDNLRRFVYNVVITQTLITEIPEPKDDDYSEVTITAIESDEQIKSIFEYGVTEMLKKALEEGKITSTNFNVKNIISFKRAVVKKYSFYRFDLILDDGDETTINCSLTVVHSSKDDENSLRRYKYEVTVVHVFVSNAEEPDQYEDVDLTEVETNTLIRGGLEYAATEIISTAIKEGKITSSNLIVKQVISCQRAVVKRFTFYRYTFILSNDDDTTIETTVTVVHDSRSGEFGIRRYEYNVTIKITLITDVSEPQDDQYEDFDYEEIMTGGEAKETLEFGATEIISLAYKKGDITETNFNIKSITATKRVTIKSFTFYRYSFILDDGDETSLDCTVTVIHSSKTGENSLRRYLYKVTITQTLITDVPEPDDSEYIEISITEVESTKVITDAITYGWHEVISKAVEESNLAGDAGLTLKTIVSCKRAIAKKYVFYRCEVILENSNGIVMTATITVIQNSQTGALCLRRYVYKITTTTVNTSTKTETETTSTTTTVVKYTEISVTDLSESIRTCIDSAVRQICTRLYKDGIIADTSFRIISIDSGFHKVEEGKSYFKFNVHIENSAGLILEISYTSVCGKDTTTVISFSVISSSHEIGKTVCIDSPEFKAVTQSLVIGNFETVDVSEVEGCSEVRDAMLFGVGLVGAQVAQQEGLEDADFSVTKINSIYRQFLAGVNYRFNVDLENTSGEKVKSTFTISANHQLATFYYVSYE